MTECTRCRRQYDGAVRFCPVDGFAAVPITDPYLGRQLLGQFQLVAACGRGATGTVYRALQTSMDRHVAVKILRSDLMTDPTIVKRFVREARAGARLCHPNIATVHLVGQTEEGVPYIVMEYIEGTPLSAVLDAPLSPARMLHISEQIASALGEAHDHSIVHRDLKPENILLTERRGDTDVVKIVDFGIAKIVADGIYSDSQISRIGTVFGTPHYIAPEQAAGGEVDVRADLYSLGCILFQMATARVPFEGISGIQVLLRHLREAPPDPRTINPQVPEPLVNLILHLLEKDRDERPQSAEALVTMLHALRETLGLAGPAALPVAPGQGAEAEGAVAPVRVEEPQGVTAAPVQGGAGVEERRSAPPRPVEERRSAPPRPVESPPGERRAASREAADHPKETMVGVGTWRPGSGVRAASGAGAHRRGDSDADVDRWTSTEPVEKRGSVVSDSEEDDLAVILPFWRRHVGAVAAAAALGLIIGGAMALRPIPLGSWWPHLGGQALVAQQAHPAVPAQQSGPPMGPGGRQQAGQGRVGPAAAPGSLNPRDRSPRAVARRKAEGPSAADANLPETIFPAGGGPPLTVEPVQPDPLAGPQPPGAARGAPSRAPGQPPSSAGKPGVAAGPAPIPPFVQPDHRPAAPARPPVSSQQQAAPAAPVAPPAQQQPAGAQPAQQAPPSADRAPAAVPPPEQPPAQPPASPDEEEDKTSDPYQRLK